MRKVNVLKAVDRLVSTLRRLEEFDVSEIDLSDRVLDNRIITLEGYIRFLETEGIPKLKKISDKIASEENNLDKAGVIND